MKSLVSANPCSDLEVDLVEILREVAKLQMGHGLDHDSLIMKMARAHADSRFEDAKRRRDEAQEALESVETKLLKKAVEDLLGSEMNLDQILDGIELNEERKALEAELEKLSRTSQKLIREDLDEILKEFERKGLIDARSPTIKLTPKGVSRLGKGYLTRIMEILARRGVGPHRVEEPGHGTWTSPAYRSYEYGDPYERINLERSILSALEREGKISDLRLSDLKVHESIVSAEVHFGILVDQSGSMNREGKIEAAVETALALSELMRIQFPEDRLRVFAFSESVKEVAPWELPEVAVPMRFTDIRGALRVFRLAVAHEAGNKQAHLITDSAPNFEDGDYVGFEKGLAGVLSEVRRYRAEGIVLNILMLDDDPELKDMAKEIAKQNLGRVFFTRPSELSRALVEDYLLSKREVLKL